MKGGGSGVGRVFGALILVIGLLIGLGALPPIMVGEFELRHINILSQITSPEKNLDKESEREIASEGEDEPQEQRIKVTKTTPTLTTAPKRDYNHIEITPIEVFDTLPNGKLEQFYRSLSDPNKVTRIAILGDSFVEGDILTQDLRERLQSRYGGAGAGFAPFDSPTAKYRGTIHSDSRGWQTYSIMQRDETSAALAEEWIVSGYISTAKSSGAESRLRATSMRERCLNSNMVRLLFRSVGGCELSVSVNGDEREKYVCDGSGELQQIVIERDSINEISLIVERGADGFIGYGAYFEGDSGVVIDNYAIRSNNGQAVLWSDSTRNSQLNTLLGGYDLVVLQYGLNLLQSGVRNYRSYGRQIERLIEFTEGCFPSAAVMVWGVSDRSIRRDGLFVAMDEALDMSRYQRAAAEARGGSFWDIHAAMEARGGMARFVEMRWAAKDYTHINSAGGRELGYAFAEAIEVAAEGLAPTTIERVELEAIIKESIVVDGLHKMSTPWER